MAWQIWSNWWAPGWVRNVISKNKVESNQERNQEWTSVMYMYTCTQAPTSTFRNIQHFTPKTPLCFLKVSLLLLISRFHKHVKISLQPSERKESLSYLQSQSFWFCCCFEVGLHCAAYSGLELIIPYLNLLSVRTASNWHHIQLNSYISTSVLQKHWFQHAKRNHHRILLLL